MFPTNPSPPHHNRPPAHSPTNSHQLLQFLALVHPLHPGGLITSDPRRWVNPLLCLSPVHLPPPSHLEGKDARATRRWGSSEQRRCTRAPCRMGLSSVKAMTSGGVTGGGGGSTNLANGWVLCCQRGLCSIYWSLGLRPGPQLALFCLPLPLFLCLKPP